MKQLRLTLLFTVIFTVISCADNGKKNQKAEHVSEERDGVEVLYFHGKKRCPTCNAIEKETEEVLRSDFQKALQNGTLTYRAIDISTPEGEALADSYEITWSSLFLVSWHNGEEKVENLTDFAFLYARNDPDRFKHELAQLIANKLSK